ncbi:phage protein [Clostridium sp. CAG:343]|jgi:uncharacterized phage protein (TIGR01671 family)|nr:phage protein [Clostridium sp. CAG:343]
MNREIKFRGKMVPENEWIFGTILRIPAPPVCFGKSESDKYYIQFPDTRYVPDWNMPYRMVQGEVNPDTIGQYTGLNDKSGKEIYRGDIVQGLFADQEEPGIKGQVIYSNDQASYMVIASNNDEWELGYLDNLEVIGNIYDNPELLGGE